MYKYLFTVLQEDSSARYNHIIYAKNLASAVQKLKNLEQVEENLIIQIEIITI